MTLLPTPVKEGIPPHLTEEKIAASIPAYHNWLYSVVPVSEAIWWSDDRNNHKELGLVAYLTGYCRNCGRAFSKKIDKGSYGEYTETIMNVPKEGCILA